MKIIDRAAEYANDRDQYDPSHFMDDNTQDFVKAFIGLGYMQGATEQRVIDYAKACNTFCKFHCGEKKGCMCEDLCKFRTLFTDGEE